MYCLIVYAICTVNRGIKLVIHVLPEIIMFKPVIKAPAHRQQKAKTCDHI